MNNEVKLSRARAIIADLIDAVDNLMDTERPSSTSSLVAVDKDQLHHLEDLIIEYREDPCLSEELY